MLRKIIIAMLEEIRKYNKKYNPSPLDIAVAQIQLTEDDKMLLFEQLIDSDSDVEFMSIYNIMIDNGLID